MDERDDGMPGWDVLEPPKTGPFLPSDDPLVKALGQPGERVFPALDVIDWWEHPDSEARRIPTGIAGAPRQLVITTRRIIVMKDGSVERSFPIRAITGAELVDPLDGQNKGSEKAVMVRSRQGEDVQVLGMWSTTPDLASRLMDSIFKFSHGLS
jgi:hypothetical protein